MDCELCRAKTDRVEEIGVVHRNMKLCPACLRDLLALSFEELGSIRVRAVYDKYIAGQRLKGKPPEFVVPERVQEGVRN